MFDSVRQQPLKTVRLSISLIETQNIMVVGYLTELENQAIKKLNFTQMILLSGHKWVI